MTNIEFNTKYKNYIEEGFVGCEITNETIINQMDLLMGDLIKIPDFKLIQLKIKWSQVTLYTNGINYTTKIAIEYYLNSLYN